MNNSDAIEAGTRLAAKGFTSSSLAKAIFNAEVPEQFIRTLPAQSIYLVTKRNGLGSSGDLIELATHEQMSLLLDFDCWEGDRFSEDRFWEWLSLSDEELGLRLLQKVLKCIDLKLISLLISRYVTVRIFEEPTDNPPGPSFYTPDKGHTWLGIQLEDSEKHFRLARLLALVFETDAKVFYQLIAIPNVSTETILEEEAYQDRNRRLTAEGIPDSESAHKTLSVIAEQSFLELSKDPRNARRIEDISAIQPLIYDSHTVQPLAGMISEIKDIEAFESELTLIMNAAVVKWQVPFFEYEATVNLASKVKGAINIGLEQGSRISRLSPTELYNRLGLQPLLRLGLSLVLPLAKLSFHSESESPELTLLNQAVRRPFPEIPVALNPDGTFSVTQGEISPELKALEKLNEVQLLKERSKNQYCV